MSESRAGAEAAVEQPPDSINAFTVVGEFGFKRLPGPFSVDKAGTVWTIVIPEDYDHPAFTCDSHDEGKAAVVVADGRVCGGGIVSNVFDPEGEDGYRVQIDQYALGDPDV